MRLVVVRVRVLVLALLVLDRQRREHAVLTPGYGTSQPLIWPQRMRFSRSVGAASGTSKRIFSESCGGGAGRPLVSDRRGFFSKSDCFGSHRLVRPGSGVSVKLARMSVAIRSNSDSVGRPSISSIVLTMLWCA